MLCGIINSLLMVRIGPDQYESVLKMKYARVMDITGKLMEGFIFVDEAGYNTASALSKWLDLGV